MNESIIGSELICIIVLIIVMYAILLSAKFNNNIINSFLMMVVTILVSLLVELVELCLIGTRFNTAIFILTTITNLMGYLIVTELTYFLLFYANEYKATNYKIGHALAIFNGVGLIQTIVLTALGKVISVNDGYITYGWGYNLVGITAIITIFILLILTCKYYKIFTRQDKLALLIYFVPIISTAIETIFPDVKVTFSGAGISMLLLYVVLQSRLVTRANTTALEMKEISEIDYLTKLGNRLSYENFLATLKNEKQIGVLYTDVNGLKITNDTYGHAFGDKLLTKYTSLLLDNFDYKNVFRISGDEFLVVIPNIALDTFKAKYDSFRKQASKNNDIASIGMSHGKGFNLSTVILEAEDKMYIEKEKYYKRNNIKRR